MLHRSSPAYVGLTLLWGFSFVLVRAVVDGFGWATAVSLSCLLIGATVAVLAVLKGASLRYRLRWRRLVLLGTGIAVQFIGLSISVAHLGTALAAAAVGTVPLFSAVIGQMWGLERITGTAAAGLVTGFIGIVVVVLFPAGGISWDFIVGMFAGLVSAIAGAMSSRYAAARLSSSGPAELVSASFLVAGVLTAPLALLLPGPGDADLLHWIGLLLLGVLLGGVGYTMELGLRESSGAPFATSARSGATMVAVFLGIIFLRESISFGQLVGVLMLIGGCLLVLGLVPSRSAPARRR
ncbi:MAG TPA: DMT family transporter [Propionicimonas sp.]|jgi:drug/metabolite transporter (DMT)-like permease|uniref:DMT family transporter n=1 Tax=Propionicimonas sp. TaxID=1955623 RepID=UPI002F40B72A